MEWEGFSDFATFGLASVRRNYKRILRAKKRELEAESAQPAEPSQKKT